MVTNRSPASGSGGGSVASHNTSTGRSPATSDNKYAKIRQQEAQFRRNVAVLALLALISFGALYAYTRDDNDNEDSINRLSYNGQNDAVRRKKGANDDSQRQQREHEEEDRRLESAFRRLEERVRELKATGVIMETDPESLEATSKFQEAARALCLHRYGPQPYRLLMDVEFQESEAEPSLTTEDRYATLTIETAPLELVPYSVFNFLEIARGYESGGIHRNAGHVLQAAVKTRYVKQPLAFQEYSPQFPHVKGTVGYCGRPSGVCWYVSIIDNSRNHGPGSQQNKNPHEADANFGKVVGGMDDVVPRIHRVMKPNRFLNDKKDWVLVTRMRIQVPANGRQGGGEGEGDDEVSDGFREWVPPPYLSSGTGSS